MWTPDGNGYWILYADGFVSASGSAVNYGSLSGVGDANPANGAVHPFGDAVFFGDMSAVHLNAPVIAASGF